MKRKWIISVAVILLLMGVGGFFFYDDIRYRIAVEKSKKYYDQGDYHEAVSTLGSFDLSKKSNDRYVEKLGTMVLVSHGVVMYELDKSNRLHTDQSNINDLFRTFDEIENNKDRIIKYELAESVEKYRIKAIYELKNSFKFTDENIEQLKNMEPDERKLKINEILSK